MARLSSGKLRRRLVPITTVLVVCLGLIISFGNFVRDTSSHETFEFQAYWPKPSQYLPNNPLPNAFLQINFTGVGAQNYTYTILAKSGIVASGQVGVSHRSPFTVYVIAPFPAILQARVVRNGATAFNQNLTLG